MTNIKFFLTMLGATLLFGMATILPAAAQADSVASGIQNDSVCDTAVATPANPTVTDTTAANPTPADATEVGTAKKVYVLPIRENIMPSAVRLAAKCLQQAREMEADYVIVDMNTYGGLVDAADSIRTAILNFPIPVYVFINNQAASAGALIAIAADRIYMREGASIGAATVVNQSGEAMPDKYQSFMRGMMRSTAEAHGKVVEGIVRGDTTWRWYRDPRIAEAMVDPTITVPGLVDSTKVVTLSTDEAIKWHFCEGRASSVAEIMAQAGVDDYVVTEYKPTTLDRVLGFLTNPAFQSVLIMLIIGGIYFELQTPGVGFPLVVAITAAVLYFSPLYLEGVLAHWELILFIAGVVLILLEIFATPGFGVLGIAGIVAVVLGLTFAMIDTDLFRYIPTGELPVGIVLRPLAMVIITVTAALILSIWLGKRFLVGGSRLSSRVVLTSSMDAGEGYVSVEADRGLEGAAGTTSTDLRPAGKVVIGGKIYEAAGDNGLFIPKGTEVTVVRDRNGVLYCRKS